MRPSSTLRSDEAARRIWTSSTSFMPTISREQRNHGGTDSRKDESALTSFQLSGSPSCNGRARWGVDIYSRNAHSWRCYRRDPFCVDTGVGRGFRQNLHCELAHLAEMERIGCSAGASLRLPAER